MPSDEVLWATTDPRGRTVTLSKDMADRRERMGKHADASHMTIDEARLIVEEPHFIQQSATDEDRESYFRFEKEVGKPPYKRVTTVVESENESFAISWGRQGRLPSHGSFVWGHVRR